VIDVERRWEEISTNGHVTGCAREPEVRGGHLTNEQECSSASPLSFRLSIPACGERVTVTGGHGRSDGQARSKSSKQATSRDVVAVVAAIRMAVERCRYIHVLYRYLFLDYSSQHIESTISSYLFDVSPVDLTV
jgi:hypothetical protein